MMNETLPDLKNNSGVMENIAESKSTVFSKNYKEAIGSPLLQNRRVFKLFNPND